MHFTRLRPSGFWTLSSTVDPAEFEAFDERQFKSINGDDGGTWAPSAPIIIAGSGLVAEPFASEDITNAGFTGAVFFDGSSNVEFQNGSAVEVQLGSEWYVRDGAAFTFDANSVLTMNGDLEVTNGVLSTGAASTVNLNGTILVYSSIAYQATKTNVLYVAPAIDGRYPPVGGGAWSSETLPDWGYDASSGLPQTMNNSQPTHWMWMRLPPLPRGATITEILIRADASPAGVRVVLPSTMPSVRLVRYASDGTRTVVATQADTSANLAAYQVPHDVTLAALTETVGDRSYRLEFNGEYGANSEAAAFWTVLSIKVTYTATRLNHCHFEA